MANLPNDKFEEFAEFTKNFVSLNYHFYSN